MCYQLSLSSFMSPGNVELSEMARNHSNEQLMGSSSQFNIRGVEQAIKHTAVVQGLQLQCNLQKRLLIK